MMNRPNTGHLTPPSQLTPVRTPLRSPPGPPIKCPECEGPHARRDCPKRLEFCIRWVNMNLFFFKIIFTNSSYDSRKISLFLILKVPE